MWRIAQLKICLYTHSKLTFSRGDGLLLAVGTAGGPIFPSGTTDDFRGIGSGLVGLLLILDSGFVVVEQLQDG